MSSVEKKENEQDIEERIFAQVRRASHIETEKIEIKPQRRSMSIHIINNPDNEVEHESIIQKLIKKRESLSSGISNIDKQILNKIVQEDTNSVECDDDEEEESVIEKQIFENIRRSSQIGPINSTSISDKIKSTVNEESED